MAGTYDADEFVYLALGRDVAHGAMPYRDFPFFHPPGVLVIFGLLDPLTHLWWPLSRLADVLIDCGTTLLVWRVGRLLYGPRPALAAAVLYALSPVVLVSAVRVDQEIPMTALCLLGLTLLVTRPSDRAAAGAGACLALACWIKYPMLLFLPAYALAAARGAPVTTNGGARGPRRVAACLAGFLVAGVLAFLPYLGSTHQLLDDTVHWQLLGRAHMPAATRVSTTLIFWLGFNVFAVVGLAWAVAGRFCGRGDLNPFGDGDEASSVVAETGRAAAAEGGAGAPPLRARAPMSRRGRRPRPPSWDAAEAPPLVDEAWHVPGWLLAAFATGAVFLFTSVTYSHYFVPVEPYAALLGGPVVARLVGKALRIRFAAVALAAGSLALAALWAAAIMGSGLRQYFITSDAAAVGDVSQALDRLTPPGAPILTNRFEYAYLAGRPWVAHYFWNDNTVVSAEYLERQLGAAGAVVLSAYRDWSPYPPGLVPYLNARYRRIMVADTAIWLIQDRRRQSGGRPGAAPGG